MNTRNDKRRTNRAFDKTAFLFLCGRAMLLFGMLWSFGFTGSCAPPSTECTNGINHLSLNPTESPCGTDCECNNQRFMGVCHSESRVCQAFERESCKFEGNQRKCIIRKELRIWSKCKDGVQICKAPGMKDLYWGDCKPIEVQSNETGKCSDGIDNDCDGKTDQDDPDCKTACSPGKTEPCYDEKRYPGTFNKGICKSGNRTCNDNGAWGECKGAVYPGTEECNEKDDDCDGQVDEGVCECTPGHQEDCYSGKFETLNKGACKAGKKTCSSAGKWGPCEGEVLPQAEVCNGKDDDCNGKVDDNPACECWPPGKSQQCYDESKHPKTKGIGLCKSGNQTCDAKGAWGVCEGATYPAKELCNKLDDDCDGQTDEELKDCQASACTSGKTKECYTGGSECSAQGGKIVCKGTCKSGTAICFNEAWGKCEGVVVPTAESCNGKDDNCDGQTDEGNPGGGVACDTGKMGVCKAGTKQCKAGKLECIQNKQPVAELCDDLDNDCDGLVDEGATGCVTLLAGTPPTKSGNNWRPQIGHVDGPALQAKFQSPGQMAFDSKGNLYILEQNRVRKLDTLGKVSTIAGDGRQGNVDGPGIQARFSWLKDAVLDSKDNIYVTEELKYFVRKITQMTNGTCGSQSNYTGYCVSTFAGDGVSGHKDGPAAKAQFEGIYGITNDNKGNFYIAEHRCLRKIDASGNVTTIAGTVTTDSNGKKTCQKGDKDGPADKALFGQIRGLLLDGQGAFYIADEKNYKIRKMSMVSNGTCGSQSNYTGWCVTTVAGTGTQGFKDGAALQAQFNGLSTMAFDTKGQLYIADKYNNAIRKLDTSGKVTTFSGGGRCSSGFVGLVGDCYENGPLLKARYAGLSGVAIDKQGVLYVSEEIHLIRKIIP